MATKRPKWIDECPKFVGHPSYVLRQAAKALELEAKELRKAKMRPEATLAAKYSAALQSVADGKTWAEALDLSPNVK